MPPKKFKLKMSDASNRVYTAKYGVNDSDPVIKMDIEDNLVME